MYAMATGEAMAKMYPLTKHPIIMGFTGYAQSGKDTAAGFHKEVPGIKDLVAMQFKRVAFADPVKELSEIVMNGVGRVLMAQARIQWNWQELTKEQIRSVFVAVGHGCREILGEDVWVHKAAKTVAKCSLDTTVLITDVRYPDEADWIRSQGGVVIRITRAGAVLNNEHISEGTIDLINPDHVVHNSGTIEELHLEIGEIWKTYAEARKLTATPNTTSD